MRHCLWRATTLSLAPCHDAVSRVVPRRCLSRRATTLSLAGPSPFPPAHTKTNSGLGVLRGLKGSHAPMECHPRRPPVRAEWPPAASDGGEESAWRVRRGTYAMSKPTPQLTPVLVVFIRGPPGALAVRGTVAELWRNGRRGAAELSLRHPTPKPSPPRPSAGPKGRRQAAAIKFTQVHREIRKGESHGRDRGQRTPLGAPCTLRGGATAGAAVAAPGLEGSRWPRSQTRNSGVRPAKRKHRYPRRRKGTIYPRSARQQ